MKKALAYLVVLVLTLASIASAQVPSRRLGVRFTSGVPSLSFSAQDLINGEVRRKLDSGLPQTIVTQVFAYREGGGPPVAATVQSCRVVYDLWEEVYRVQVQGVRADRSESVPSIDGVVRRCLVMRDHPVGIAADFSAVRNARVYFAVMIELNPMSPETVRRIRRWLARPSGSGRLESDAFFGSFVSLFVNRRIGAAERTLSFRSQAVAVP